MEIKQIQVYTYDMLKTGVLYKITVIFIKFARLKSVLYDIKP